jgi:hypothetical protein
MRPAMTFVVGTLILYLLWTGKALRTWKALTT